jgi:hypothetical protein
MQKEQQASVGNTRQSRPEAAQSAFFEVFAPDLLLPSKSFCCFSDGLAARMAVSVSGTG